MLAHIAAPSTFFIFAPPYDALVPFRADLVAQLSEVDQWKGRALVWQLAAGVSQDEEFEALRCKPPGLPLLVLLPPPADIGRIADVLPLVRLLAPRMILPHGLLDSAYRLRQVFAMPPRSLPGAVTDYLIRRGLLHERKAVRDFHRILELAPDTRSIAALSRRMYTSRRTLGRHFVSIGMPVPSHCLHFGRLLHVAVQLQVDDGAMFRVATRFGYPDGFTMSNQMKRLIGYRPSQVRELLGWEWVVEAWLRQEGVRDG